MATLLPEIQRFLDRLQAVGYPEASQFTPAEARANQSLAALIQTRFPGAGQMEERKVPGPDGELVVRIYRPDVAAGATSEAESEPASEPAMEAEPLPALVWFHGGGWVIGSLDDADHTCRVLASGAHCAVISVEYRLAPETPFPGPFEDCLAVTEWVVANGTELGLDPTRVAVGGDSAGGNLAACVALAARDREIDLVLQLLVYPIIAADFDTASYQTFATGYHLLRNDVRWSWDHYVEESQRRDPRVSPIEGDLAGVAPTWLFAAEADVLVDEGRRYAEALAAAGVAVERYEMAGVIHGSFTQRFQCSKQARARAVEALRQAFGSEAAAPA